jgi:NADPH:quinone reductase
MKAMLARAWGEPSTLEYVDAPVPRPNAGEVLIEVRAIGCNVPDILIVQGTHQHRPERSARAARWRGSSAASAPA